MSLPLQAYAWDRAALDCQADFDICSALGRYRLFKSLRQNVEDVPQASQEFFFSIAVNRLDANVRRGACIKAIGIVTTHRFFRAFEPLMQSALDECFQELLLPSATPSPSKHQAESNADAEGAEHKEEESYPTSSEERKRALASNEEAVARLLRKLNSTTIAADGTGDGASDAEGAPTSVPVLYVVRRCRAPCWFQIHIAFRFAPSPSGVSEMFTFKVSTRSPQDAEAQGFDYGSA